MNKRRRYLAKRRRAASLGYRQMLEVCRAKIRHGITPIPVDALVGVSFAFDSSLLPPLPPLTRGQKRRMRDTHRKWADRYDKQIVRDALSARKIANFNL